MGSVLGSFGAFQGKNWSVAPFIPVGPVKISEKTQKMHFFQNSCTELSKIKNLHSTICLKVFPSSGRVALPPAFAQIEGRGVIFRLLLSSDGD